MPVACDTHTHTQVMCVVHFFLFGGCVRPSNFQGYKSHKEQVSDVEKTCNPLAGSRTESPLVALYIERGRKSVIKGNRIQFGKLQSPNFCF